MAIISIAVDRPARTCWHDDRHLAALTRWESKIPTSGFCLLGSRRGHLPRPVHDVGEDRSPEVRIVARARGLQLLDVLLNDIVHVVPLPQRRVTIPPYAFTLFRDFGSTQELVKEIRRFTCASRPAAQRVWQRLPKSRARVVSPQERPLRRRQLGAVIGARESRWQYHRHHLREPSTWDSARDLSEPRGRSVGRAGGRSCAGRRPRPR
jgi:hypothetical protein